MEQRQVTLPEMLDAREARAQRQRELLREHPGTLISFTMNIAGPVKNSDLILRGFTFGVELLLDTLQAAGMAAPYREVKNAHTGNEALLCVEGDPLAVKRLTAGIEDGHPIGRLFDMDVLQPSGEQVSRRALDLPERICLLCGQPAKVCASRRVHSVAELQQKTIQLLGDFFAREDAHTIARLACQSLLYEVCTTPKPGLVDRANSGSHKDMDIFTFMGSASALWPYFEQCAHIGMRTAGQAPAETFRQLRQAGKEAERTMLAVTGGVNTHKGAIFSVGVVCGALGRLSREHWGRPELVLQECARLTAGITGQDFHGITLENAQTAGQKLFVRHGLTGIRGEAEQGFPAVLTASLPTLEQGLRQGLSLNDAGCAALLALIAATTDTNLRARSDRATQLEVAAHIRDLLADTPFPAPDVLERLDKAFIQKNLSPGGCADLLAITYFLHFLRDL